MIPKKALYEFKIIIGSSFPVYKKMIQTHENIDAP